MYFFLRDTEFPKPIKDRRRMTAETFRNFFEPGIRGRLDIFDELFRDDFLIDRTADFCFYISGCLISFFSVNNCTDVYFEHCRSLCQ